MTTYSDKVDQITRFVEKYNVGVSGSTINEIIEKGLIKNPKDFINNFLTGLYNYYKRSCNDDAKPLLLYLYDGLRDKINSRFNPEEEQIKMIQEMAFGTGLEPVLTPPLINSFLKAVTSNSEPLRQPTKQEIRDEAVYQLVSNLNDELTSEVKSLIDNYANNRNNISETRTKLSGPELKPEELKEAVISDTKHFLLEVIPSKMNFKRKLRDSINGLPDEREDPYKLFTKHELDEFDQDFFKNFYQKQVSDNAGLIQSQGVRQVRGVDKRGALIEHVFTISQLLYSLEDVSETSREVKSPGVPSLREVYETIKDTYLDLIIKSIKELGDADESGVPSFITGNKEFFEVVDEEDTKLKELLDNAGQLKNFVQKKRVVLTDTPLTFYDSIKSKHKRGEEMVSLKEDAINQLLIKYWATGEMVTTDQVSRTKEEQDSINNYLSSLAEAINDDEFVERLRNAINNISPLFKKVVEETRDFDEFEKKIQTDVFSKEPPELKGFYSIIKKNIKKIYSEYLSTVLDNPQINNVYNRMHLKLEKLNEELDRVQLKPKQPNPFVDTCLSNIQNYLPNYTIQDLITVKELLNQDPSTKADYDLLTMYAVMKRLILERESTTLTINNNITEGLKELTAILNEFGKSRNELIKYSTALSNIAKIKKEENLGLDNLEEALIAIDLINKKLINDGYQPLPGLSKQSNAVFPQAMIDELKPVIDRIVDEFYKVETLKANMEYDKSGVPKIFNKLTDDEKRVALTIQEHLINEYVTRKRKVLIDLFNEFNDRISQFSDSLKPKDTLDQFIKDVEKVFEDEVKSVGEKMRGSITVDHYNAIETITKNKEITKWNLRNYTIIGKEFSETLDFFQNKFLHYARRLFELDLLTKNRSEGESKIDHDEETCVFCNIKSGFNKVFNDLSNRLNSYINLSIGSHQLTGMPIDKKSVLKITEDFINKTNNVVLKRLFEEEPDSGLISRLINTYISDWTEYDRVSLRSSSLMEQNILKEMIDFYITNEGISINEASLKNHLLKGVDGGSDYAIKANELIRSKKQFLDRLLGNKDITAEYLINEFKRLVSNDPSLIRHLGSRISADYASNKVNLDSVVYILKTLESILESTPNSIDQTSLNNIKNRANEVILYYTAVPGQMLANLNMIKSNIDFEEIARNACTNLINLLDEMYKNSHFKTDFPELAEAYEKGFITKEEYSGVSEGVKDLINLLKESIKESLEFEKQKGLVKKKDVLKAHLWGLISKGLINQKDFAQKEQEQKDTLDKLIDGLNETDTMVNLGVALQQVYGVYHDEGPFTNSAWKSIIEEASSTDLIIGGVNDEIVKRFMSRLFNIETENEIKEEIISVYKEKLNGQIYEKIRQERPGLDPKTIIESMSENELNALKGAINLNADDEILRKVFEGKGFKSDFFDKVVNKRTLAKPVQEIVINGLSFEDDLEYNWLSYCFKELPGLFGAEVNEGLIKKLQQMNYQRAQDYFEFNDANIKSLFSGLNELFGFKARDFKKVNEKLGKMLDKGFDSFTKTVDKKLKDDFLNNNVNKLFVKFDPNNYLSSALDKRVEGYDELYKNLRLIASLVYDNCLDPIKILNDQIIPNNEDRIKQIESFIRMGESLPELDNFTNVDLSKYNIDSLKDSYDKSIMEIMYNSKEIMGVAKVKRLNERIIDKAKNVLNFIQSMSTQGADEIAEKSSLISKNLAETINSIKGLINYLTKIKETKESMHIKRAAEAAVSKPKTFLDFPELVEQLEKAVEEAKNQ